MQLAEDFVGSNDFWVTLISSAVAILGFGVGAWVTLTARWPKMGLSWKFKDINLIQDAAHNLLVVAHGGQRITMPRLVIVEIRNTGRRDIERSAFHDGDPIVFNLGNPITAMVESGRRDGTARILDHLIDGKRFKVQPGLIPRGQVFKWSCLIDGPRAPVRLEHAQLTNIKVKDDETDSTYPSRREKQGWILLYVGFVAAVMLILPHLDLDFSPPASVKECQDYQNFENRQRCEQLVTQLHDLKK